jgi:hypothetical protein
MREIDSCSLACKRRKQAGHLVEEKTGENMQSNTVTPVNGQNFPVLSATPIYLASTGRGM